jgi:hypothetical protein
MRLVGINPKNKYGTTSRVDHRFRCRPPLLLLLLRQLRALLESVLFRATGDNTLLRRVAGNRRLHKENTQRQYRTIKNASSPVSERK